MISRDELYRLVWSEPMNKVASRFDVSGSYLARVCAVLNVPRPERGYWAKLAAGKAPAQTPLPEALAGNPVEWGREDEPLSIPKPATPRARGVRKRARVAWDEVHEMLVGARAHFENGRKIDEGEYLRPYKKLLVDVTTSQAGLDKALALANGLFNALDSAGHRIVIPPAAAQLARSKIDEREGGGTPREYWQHGRLWSPDRPTVVYVGNVAIGLAIVEMSENVTLRYVRGKYIRESDYLPPRSQYTADHSWTTTKDIPSGRFRIVAYSTHYRVDVFRQWQETKAKLLDGQLAAIAKEIEAMAPALVPKIEEAERKAECERQQWIAEQRRQEIAEDQQRIRRSVTESKSDLRKVIDQWAEVVSTERFLSQVENGARKLPEPEQQNVLGRLALARSFVGTQDPLEFLLAWKTPKERYLPQFPNEEGEDDDIAEQDDDDQDNS